MPANIDCPCGHTVRVPDELVKTRIKCPVCGELLSVESAQPENEPTSSVVPTPVRPTPVRPTQASVDSPATPKDTPKATAPEANTQESSDPYQTQKPSTLEPTDSKHVSSFHALGGLIFAWLPTPKFFARTSVSLLSDRVRIVSKGFLSSRRLDLRLSEITSVETRVYPAWYLLVLGVPTLQIGVGVILVFAFFFVRHSYLILRCGTATATIRFKGDDTDARAIGDDILQAARSELALDAGAN